MTKSALVCGAGGFIGAHLVKSLKNRGYRVRAVDRKYPEFGPSPADEYVVQDLRDPLAVAQTIDQSFDEVYQLAAEMGGAEYTYVGSNDIEIMKNSTMIHLNVLEACRKASVKRIFFSSSACIYPTRNQEDPDNPQCAESLAYPAEPDSEYGWEKLYGERLYLAYGRHSSMRIRIARYHNVFGPEGAWQGGREKAPAALCRKIAAAKSGDEIEIIGDGKQSRSFLFFSEAIEGTFRLMQSDIDEPLNIGSEELVTIDQLADLIMAIAGKSLAKKYVSGPVGVRGRNSDNTLIERRLGWKPSLSLKQGLEATYAWVEAQVVAAARSERA